jgi:hypothetical protein
MASNIQRIEEKKRLRTTSPTGWASKKPVEEVRSDPRLVKLLSLDCKDGNAGVCIVLPPSARLRIGRAGFAQLSLKGVTLWLIWVTNGTSASPLQAKVFGNDTNCGMA